MDEQSEEDEAERSDEADEEQRNNIEARVERGRQTMLSTDDVEYEATTRDVRW